MQGPATASQQRLDQLRRAIEILNADPGWLADLATAITEAIHTEMPELDADDALRRGTYASSESVVRNLVDMVWAGRTPEEADSPPAWLEYAREFGPRGLPLD